jgi:CPA2 family monovalent cation:H+ antiporter-2
VLHLVQQHAPQVPVVVRTLDDSDLEKLRAAGATEVVPEALEGSLMLASQALALVGVPLRRVIRLVQDARYERYGLLRDYFHGADDDTASEAQQPRLRTVSLPPGGQRGAPLGLLALDGWACMWCRCGHRRPCARRRGRLRAERRRHPGALRAPEAWPWPKPGC